MASLQPLTGVLGPKRAAHLLRRCTFSFNANRIDVFATFTANQAVGDLFNPRSYRLEEPISYDTLTPWINSGLEQNNLEEFALVQYVRCWWVEEARLDPSIFHKLAFFLHNNWTIHTDAANSRRIFDHLKILRHFASGSYKELAKKMTIDNTMLSYLDGDSNTKYSPNENYAREFLELFTIGKGPQIGPGDYTYFKEEDIVTASKLLTGFEKSVRPLGGDPNFWDNDIGVQLGYPRFGDHDVTDKTFSTAFNQQTISGATSQEDMLRELDDFVEMVFAQEATAKNICRKLYRFFVRSKITNEIETDIITPLATTLINNDYQLEPCVEQLLKSEHFFDEDDQLSGDEIFGSMLKSPLEKVLHTLNFFNVQIPDVVGQTEDHYRYWYRNAVLNSILPRAGMDLFKPDSVAGYPAYYQEPGYSENWFTGATLIARYKYPEMLITGRKILDGGDLGGVQLDFVDFIANSGVIDDPSDGPVLVETLCTYLFPEPPTTDRLNYFINDIFLDQLSPINWYFEWLNYVNSGDDSAVRIPLEKLFKALISSQEYQLS